jgi:hypothetical protein
MNRKVPDLSKLVLNVDLWNLHGIREDNCVKHNNTSPSISSSITSVYPAAIGPQPPSFQPLPSYDLNRLPTYGQTRSGPQPNPLSPIMISSPSSVATYISTPASVNGNGYVHGGPSSPANYNYSGGHQGLQPARGSQDMGSSRGEGIQVAKNLIGSSSSSAFRLKDMDNKVGLWFILQDLSVRTEGWFRLKMNFFSLGEFNLTTDSASAGNLHGGLLEQAPCLASVFSKPFKVWSAKKFPGVIETTELSRSFAKQGIKIPIRKGENRKRKAGANDSAEEDDEQD